MRIVRKSVKKDNECLNDRPEIILKFIKNIGVVAHQRYCKEQ